MSFFNTLYTCTPQPVVTVVCSKSVPEQLITFHKAFMEQACPGDYHIRDLGNGEIEDLFAQLSITFLGQSFIYGLKDGDLSANERKKFDLFLKNYHGPHTIYFFTSDAAYEKNALVLDIKIDKAAFQEFIQHHKLSGITTSFIDALFAYKPVYTFDEAVKLITYGQLLGARSEQFFSTWITRILSQDVSLFTLSQHFFAQHKAALLQLWQTVQPHYPPEFWIAYFSEQLWQATLFVQCAQAGKAAQAKPYTYRLPFSFTQKDWKKYTVKQLMNAQRFLYEVDHGLKNGYATDGIELFIHAGLK